MRQVTDEILREVLERYRFHGTLTDCRPHGSGHINDTYLLDFDMYGMGRLKVILQRINSDVFQNPADLMENIIGVTSHLREKILSCGGDPERETLNLVPAGGGERYLFDSQGGCWRAYRFISGASCYDQARSPRDFYESAVAFGRFQAMMSDFPARRLHETIPGFHDTAARLEALRTALREDRCGRAKAVQEEAAFALEREETAKLLEVPWREGALPLRVTHNDTKLNNIMLDDRTGKGICVIDLDTVMPGFSVNDFGDAIRFGASTAAEDEKNLEKVSCSMELFEAYARGFLEGCGGRLTETEIELLPSGAKGMTFECGVRFLTDYLEGDRYFKVSREGHNLDRCRTQFKLVRDMEAKWQEMNAIIRECSR